MADGVDAVVHPVQPPGGCAVCDRAAWETQRLELTERDDAVLARRERRDPAIQRGLDEFGT
jgi:hypothetical protein